MIQVSNEFKKAIKKQERQIKGYVEILYDLSNITVTPTTNITSSYTPLAEICNGVRVENLYGSLDHLPLDGSYLTMGTTNTNIGFISNELFENLTTPTVTLSFSSKAVKGITLYFRENIPTNLTLNYSDGSSDTIINENEIVQVIFENFKTLTSVQVVINDMMYQDRKIYLMEIDLGITQVYKDQDLIEFTIDEEVNKLVEEVPVNETNVILNNMSNLFNPLNPTGIVPYLSENTLIKPYIGVLTDTLGVEYVKMGEFYFDSCTNNSDSTTTLVGKNIIKQIQSEILKADNEYNLFKSSMSKTDFQTFMQNYRYTFNSLDYSMLTEIFNINKKYLIDFLQEISFFNTTLFYADRNSNLNLKSINVTTQDNLTKTELINDVNFKKIDKINTLSYLSPAEHTMNTTGSRLVYDRTITLETSPQYLLCESNSANMMDSIVHADGSDSVSVISQGYYFTFIKLTGTVGSTINIKMASPYDIVETIGTQTKSIKQANEKEVVLNFESKMKKNINNINTLSYTPSYEIRFDYNGDPSLEAGDYISVQTPYGYKSLFIQKNRFKFDGGLSGSIEGVE